MTLETLGLGGRTPISFPIDARFTSFSSITGISKFNNSTSQPIRITYLVCVCQKHTESLKLVADSRDFRNCLLLFEKIKQKITNTQCYDLCESRRARAITRSGPTNKIQSTVHSTCHVVTTTLMRLNIMPPSPTLSSRIQCIIIYYFFGQKSNLFILQHDCLFFCCCCGMWKCFVKSDDALNILCAIRGVASCTDISVRRPCMRCDFRVWLYGTLLHAFLDRNHHLKQFISNGSSSSRPKQPHGLRF